MRFGARAMRAFGSVCFGVLGAFVFLLPTVALQRSLDTPPVTARSVFALDPATGEVIMEENANERLAIGSITKVMTAIVVADHSEMDEPVTIVGADMVPPGFSAMGLQPGDTLTVEQLLTGMLVVSGGDAARALARHVGKGFTDTDSASDAISAFVGEMNAKAATLGLIDTRFANPDGDDDDDAWSTAQDVAKLFAAMEETPQLSTIASEASYEFTSIGPEATPYEGQSTNMLVGVDGVTAAKTGSTVAAGACLVLARTGASGRTEIIAILGSDLQYDEMWNATSDERWTDARIVMEAIDSDWTPGQNLVLPTPTTVPALDHAASSTPSSAVEIAPGEPRIQQERRPHQAPIVAGVVAVCVILLAGIHSGSRSIPPR